MERTHNILYKLDKRKLLNKRINFDSMYEIRLLIVKGGQDQVHHHAGQSLGVYQENFKHSYLYASKYGYFIQISSSLENMIYIYKLHYKPGNFNIIIAQKTK